MDLEFDFLELQSELPHHTVPHCLICDSPAVLKHEPKRAVCSKCGAVTLYSVMQEAAKGYLVAGIMKYRKLLGV